MAQIRKLAAQYFTHDADMRNDVKIKALRRKFSHTGYAVWNYLLEVLTDIESFEINFDDVTKELFAADFDVTVQQLTDIVDYCIKIGLLQKEGNRLFSAAHQRRFQSIIERFQRRSEAGKKGMASRWGNRSNSAQEDNGVITSDNNVITPDNIIEEKRIEENRKEKNRTTYPYQDIADKWNSICGEFLPKVQKISDSRKQKIKSRLQEFGQPEAWMPTIEAIFETIAESDFLRGKNNTGWSATFDWIFENPKNWVKVLEGNYNNHKGGKPTRPQVNLGAGEYIDETGRRTYGTGKATIPNDAPPRPSERHCWDASSNQWILL